MGGSATGLAGGNVNIKPEALHKLNAGVVDPTKEDILDATGKERDAASALPLGRKRDGPFPVEPYQGRKQLFD
jgi:hypothetical protein